MTRIPTDEKEIVQEQRRERLLLAAAYEIAQGGFTAANVKRISHSAGFATGTIYNYFPTKRALMLALIDRIAEKHLDLVRKRVGQVDHAQDRLQNFFKAGFQFVDDHPDDSRVVVSIVYGPDVEFRNYIYSAYGPLFTLLTEEILEEGIAAGIFRPLELSSAAALIMSVYLGASSQVDAQGKIWLKPEEVVQFVFNGISA